MKKVVKYLGLYLLFAIAIATLELPLIAKSESQPLWNHVFLTGWGALSLGAVAVRVWRKTKSLSKGLEDGMIAGAIIYAGLALFSTALVDFSAVGNYPSNYLIILFLLESILLFAGTMILIRKSTDW